MKKKIILITTILIGIIAVVFLFVPTKPKTVPLSIVSSIPTNSSVFVNEKIEIIFTLNRNIETEEGKDLKITTKPSTKTEIVYLENKIRISPETIFNMGTDYTINVLYKEKNIYTLNFSTNPFTQEMIKDEGDKQTEGDLNFNKAYKDFLTNYPWYTNLPIDTFQYRVVYDFEKESFRIRLKIKPQDEIQQEEIINKATGSIKNLGVEEPIQYYILDTEGFILEP